MPDGTRTETADVDAGIETLRRLEEVKEATATGQVAEVFDGIRDTLRSPIVPAPLRILAAGPFLVPAWRAVEPLVGSIGFEERADRFRAEVAALVGQPEGPLEIDLPADDERRLRGFLDAQHYVLPKTALVLELFDRVAREDTDGSIVLSKDPVPREVPRDAAAVPLLEVSEAQGPIRSTFKDIQRQHDHPFVADVYRGLSAWPLFLQNAWGILSPAVGSDSYRDLSEQVQTKAMALVSDLDLTDSGIKDGTLRGADLEEARDLLAAFRYRSEPDVLQDMVRLKAVLDGSDAAKVSRFSAARAGK